MKVLLLYEYPPLPAGLSTQGELLRRGLQELGVDVHAAHLESDHEKDWYYRWFAPHVVVGVGYWGYAPYLVLHPQQHGMLPVPWLVANGYIGNFEEALNRLPLILTTSHWVRDVYIRDGIDPKIIEVLPVGCDTDVFVPRPMDDPQVAALREALGVSPDHLLLLTVGGDAASKGAREVMQALALLGDSVPEWRYVCKVWPQQRTTVQTPDDLFLAQSLGIADRMIFVTSTMSRNVMPFMLNACDIYCGPSRQEGFGMPHVEAGACGRPVLAIDAMAFRDTLVHGETAFLAGVARENRITETVLGEGAGDRMGQRVVFDPPRIVDYRARVEDIAEALLKLMRQPELRHNMGEAGRRRVVEHYDYRVVARQFLDITTRRLSMPAESAEMGLPGTTQLNAPGPFPDESGR